MWILEDFGLLSSRYQEPPNVCRAGDFHLHRVTSQGYGVKEENKGRRREANEAATLVTRREEMVAVEAERTGQSREMLWRQN